ncbi:Uncharacterized protein DBV15_04568 [Temnothorax longispinosus]|uniref:Uncharacterized protein n=1 Tax=Temnothorax longispinosus TaxID=300112 RepID=A0A4S2KG60_9HYME|nr:Uncharacterized protein DBV15_04568 [Temnothorax longispinosus]
MNNIAISTNGLSMLPLVRVIIAISTNDRKKMRVSCPPGSIRKMHQQALTAYGVNSPSGELGLPPKPLTGGPFRLLCLYRVSLALYFSLPLSPLLPRINYLSPGQDTSYLLYTSEISHSLPPSLSISGFWSTPRVKRDGEERKEVGKR